ncbi:MAG: hypothetical protein GX410_01430 [Elusimicrobia bacterium]|nr:hypothetical protein [Elusimicrobiota bacterium]
MKKYIFLLGAVLFAAPCSFAAAGGSSASSTLGGIQSSMPKTSASQSQLKQPKLTATPVFVFSDNAKPGSHLANAACAIGDKIEDKILRFIIKHEHSREMLEKKLGAEHKVLYRVITPPERQSLVANGWVYDVNDKKHNRYKFAMPQKATAVQTLRKCGGDELKIVEITTDTAIPYYKLSKKFTSPKYVDAVQEYIFIVDGTETIRLLDESEYDN